jgi:hypothetical protein
MYRRRLVCSAAGRSAKRQDTHIGVLRGRTNDFPSLLPADRMRPATLGTLPREEERVTVREPTFLCPE